MLSFEFTSTDDDSAALDAQYERIASQFEARKQSRAEFFESLKGAPGVAEVLTGHFKEWHSQTPELRSLCYWALERQGQIARHCPVSRPN